MVIRKKKIKTLQKEYEASLKEKIEKSRERFKSNYGFYPEDDPELIVTKQRFDAITLYIKHTLLDVKDRRFNKELAENDLEKLEFRKEGDKFVKDGLEVSITETLLETAKEGEKSKPVPVVLLKYHAPRYSREEYFYR